jgi:hypothetical protein
VKTFFSLTYCQHLYELVDGVGVHISSLCIIALLLEPENEQPFASLKTALRFLPESFLPNPPPHTEGSPPDCVSLLPFFFVHVLLFFSVGLGFELRASHLKARALQLEPHLCSSYSS